jgi:hypothetical protein
MALLVSFINNPYQANRAQMEPPEVPLKATMIVLLTASERNRVTSTLTDNREAVKDP